MRSVVGTSCARSVVVGSELRKRPAAQWPDRRARSSRSPESVPPSVANQLVDFAAATVAAPAAASSVRPAARTARRRGLVFWRLEAHTPRFYVRPRRPSPPGAGERAPHRCYSELRNATSHVFL